MARQIETEAYRLQRPIQTLGVLNERKQGFTSLSPFAEEFRGKLLSHFRGIEQIGALGSKGEIVDDPLAFPGDFEDIARLRRTMRDRPYATVVALPPTEMKKQSNATTQGSRYVRARRTAKAKLSDKPPISLFAHWFVYKEFFQQVIFLLILLNAITLAISAEIRERQDPNWQLALVIMENFDTFALVIFSFEIVLKWIDDFYGFWSNAWNVFDFILTIASFPPVILDYTPFGDVTEGVEILKVFRITRLLKLLTRSNKTRILATAITQSFQVGERFWLGGVVLCHLPKNFI